MRRLAVVLSLGVALVGAIGLVSPAALLGFARHFQSPSGLYAAAALRVILGSALFLSAPTSRSPRAIRFLGVFIFVAGLITPLFGAERAREILDWASTSDLRIRLWAAFALGFGGTLSWALLPRSGAA